MLHCPPTLHKPKAGVCVSKESSAASPARPGEGCFPSVRWFLTTAPAPWKPHGPRHAAFEQLCVSAPLELSDQIQRALQLEEERKRAQEEAERLEADRMAALRAKEELERQAVDQIKSQEQLVGVP